MSVIDDYLETLSGPEKQTIAHMYALVRHWVPTATEELSYGMPAFTYEGKGLISVMSNKDFLSLYPFCAVGRLGIDLDAYEKTSGSIHFSVDKPLPDELLQRIVQARQQIIRQQ